jgi:hypothetical protein
LEDVASDDEGKEVSSDEKANPKANQPNAKAVGVALRTRQRAATQRRRGYPELPDHKATPEADQVRDSGKKAYLEADRGRGGGSTNPRRNRASAEALPKIFSPLAASNQPDEDPGRRWSAHGGLWYHGCPMCLKNMGRGGSPRMEPVLG